MVDVPDLLELSFVALGLKKLWTPAVVSYPLS